MAAATTSLALSVGPSVFSVGYELWQQTHIILPLNGQEYEVWNLAVYNRKSRFVISKLTKRVQREKVEGTVDDLNIPFYAKKKKDNAVAAFGLN